MAVNLIFPTNENPYIIDSNTPIIIRTVCYAGVNRSATIREILKQKNHKDSVIFSQLGYTPLETMDQQYLEKIPSSRLQNIDSRTILE